MGGTPEGARKGLFTKFQKRISGTEEWSSPFAKALSLTLIEKGIDPGELAIRIGRDHRNTWHYLARGVFPRREIVREIEDALELPVGQLELSIPKGERTKRSGKTMRRVWKDPKKNYSAEEYRLRMLNGDFHGGHRPGNSKRWTRETPGYSLHHHYGPDPMRTRIRKAIGRFTLTVGSSFVLGVSCRKALCRLNSLLVWENHFHGDCWREYRAVGNYSRDKDKRRERGRKSPGGLDQMMRYWLTHNIVGESYGAIANRDSEMYGQNPNAVAHGVKRANKWMPTKWGDLFPSGSRKRSNIHKVLAGFDIADVVAIAEGHHELSDETDASIVQDWLRAHTIFEPYRWNVGDVADSDLARLLASRITGRYDSKADAAKAVGVSISTLYRLLRKSQVYICKTTKDQLSTFLKIDAEELRSLIRRDDGGRGRAINANRVTEIETPVRALRTELAILESTVRR